MQNLRAALILTLFFTLTIPAMVVQLVLLGVNARAARRLPHWYHRLLCRLLNIRIHTEGEIAQGRPALMVANHVSWLDIPVIGALAPLSFVAKREVSTWPFVSWLAWLQRTVFVDRERRGRVGDTAKEILERLRAGDTIVLFAEGTSSDGNRVLPFQSSLFAAAKPADSPPDEGIYVQTLAVAYTHVHGLPIAIKDRPEIAWYGDMEMAGHVWRVLKLGPLDVHIRIGKAIAMSDFADRKALSRQCEKRVRADLAHLISNRRGPLTGVAGVNRGMI